MRKLELILMTLIVLSTILWFFTLPFVGIFMLILINLLAVFYLGFGLLLFNKIKFKNLLKKDSYKDISGLRKIGSIVTGLSFSLICIGSLFKLQSYSGAETILIDGLILLFVVAIISILKFLKSRSDFYKRILIRSTIIGGFGLLIFFMPN